jgi:hypothetical protein
MSATPPDLDVETLLRRTYAAVAGRTTVAAAGPGEDVPSWSGRRVVRFRRQRLFAAVAALLALFVGGLLVMSDRTAEAPAGRDQPTRILPGWIPVVTSSDGRLRTFPLTELHSEAERDRITYATSDASMSVVLDRTRGLTAGGEPVSVRGASGRRSASTLSWIGPGGALVEVSWTGAVDDTMVDHFVRGLAFVDEDTWTEAAGTGGFRRAMRDPLVTVRIDGDEPFEVGLVGDLHEGLIVQVGEFGLLAGYERCQASWKSEISDLEAAVAGYLLAAPGDVTSVVVRTGDSAERRVELQSLLPVVDLSLGSTVYENRTETSETPRVDCGDRS